MGKDNLEIKKLEIKLEELKIQHERVKHFNKMQELELKKEIAIVYRSKKGLNKIKKEIKKNTTKEKK